MKKDSTSLFTPYIDEMLDFKVCLGYERKTYKGFLNDFSRYCAKYYPIQKYLTKELVLAWCMRRPTENPSGFRRRIIVVREFAKYMEAIGQESYILPSHFSGGRVTFTPYIFSDEELVTFFTESDSMELNRWSPYRHVILPVMLRMIYFCGLRPNEGREIQKKDVNLNDGILFIRKNKSHMERYVPMSEDMRNLCVSYNEKLRFFAPESEFFFPNTTGTPYSAKWLTRQFLGIWEKIRNNQYPQRARVYDLRHRFATAIMMQWLNDGEDLYAKLPYLSTYMGNSQFSNTAYCILHTSTSGKPFTFTWHGLRVIFRTYTGGRVMVGKESIHFFQLIKDFLTVYIPWQKASSPNTVRAYRDALNLLLGYLKEIGNLKLSEISFDIITRQTVESYLDWLEVTRNNSVATRNHRLSCIRTFYRYASGRDMLVIACSFELEKIPIKRIINGHIVNFFEEDALGTILCQPNTVTKKGIPDLFYMILMYDTAARNQEILDLKVSDIYTSAKESHVVITGKGSKTRIVPLMRKTVEHFNNYLHIFHDGQISNSLLFYVVQKGHRQAISPNAVGKFMKIYGKTAREQNSNVPENLHPHMLRHYGECYKMVSNPDKT